MAHQRLGHLTEARRCLAEAARWIETADRGEDDVADTRPTWSDWHERVIYPLLVKEAEELIMTNSG